MLHQILAPIASAGRVALYAVHLIRMIKSTGHDREKSRWSALHNSTEKNNVLSLILLDNSADWQCPGAVVAKSSLDQSAGPQKKIWQCNNVYVAHLWSRIFISRHEYVYLLPTQLEATGTPLRCTMFNLHGHTSVHEHPTIEGFWKLSLAAIDELYLRYLHSRYLCHSECPSWHYWIGVLVDQLFAYSRKGFPEGFLWRQIIMISSWFNSHKYSLRKPFRSHS